jgi:hypothetical protein
MGTDIHLSAEVQNDEGEWEYVPGPVIECWLCDGTGIAHQWAESGSHRVPTGQPCQWCTNDGSNAEDEWDRAYYERRYVEPGKIRDTWYSDRNYLVFAMLADVRNGFGFAGVETFKPVVPIAEPRGLPEDITEGTKNILSDEHSQTWMTLDEALAYNWNQSIEETGVVDAAEYQWFKDHGRPRSWSGGISGGNVEEVSAEDMDRLIEVGMITIDEDTEHPGSGLRYPTAKNGVLYVTRVRWTDSTDWNTRWFQDRLAQLKAIVGDRPCRLVMDFDS